MYSSAILLPTARERQTGRRPDTESKTGGGGGGDAWRGPGRKAVTGNRLPTLKQQLKHSI